VVQIETSEFRRLQPTWTTLDGIEEESFLKSCFQICHPDISGHANEFPCSRLCTLPAANQGLCRASL